MTGTRHLFFVAVSSYKDRKMARLPGVSRDALRLRETLTKYRDGPTHVFKWLTDGDATKQDILDGLAFLGMTAKTEDQVVLYLGLHAWREHDATDRHWRYFLLPWDATPAMAETHGISTDELGAAIREIQASEVVLILDCCYAGGLPDVRWLNEMHEEFQDGWRNLLVLAASRGHDETIDANGGGLFIPAFCDALAGRGVQPEADRRIYAQMAGCHAAFVANAEADRLGHRQVAISAGYAAPIPLTRIGDEGAAMLRRYISTYPLSQDKEFMDEVKRRIPKSKRILLVGTGLNVLWDPDIVDMLFEHAVKTGAQIDICLGNPYNPSVQNRLIEEDMMNRMAPLGQGGIERLYETCVKRMLALGPSRTVNVRLFESHPTGATLIFDKNVFYYPYGYRELGTRSPIEGRVDDGQEDVRFYVDNAERIFSESVPAEEVFRARHEPHYVGKDWIAAAIYVVPEASHPLYSLGSRLLGFDLRTGAATTGRCPVPGFRRFVGEAVEYGFHVTIGDALYFGTPAALERVKAELRFLTRQYPMFKLTGLELAYPFHENPEIVALCCQDPSGVAEALHHEIVAKIYSTAISTTYKAGTTSKAVPQTPRTELMIEKHGAPFILSAFEPHFTLGSSYHASEDEGGVVLERLRRAVAEACRRPISVRELRLLVKPAGATRWMLDPAEYHLKRTPELDRPEPPFRGTQSRPARKRT